MKLLSKSKLLVKEIKQETEWAGYEDKEAAKLGTVSFDFKGEDIEVKKGTEIYYQYGNVVKINGEEFNLISERDILCQK